MSSQELCKLDEQSPGHAGRRSRLLPVVAQAGVFREASVPFLGPISRADAGDAQASEPASAVLRRRGQIALRLAQYNGTMTEEACLDALGAPLGMSRVPLGLIPPDPTLQDLLDPSICLRYQCLPWRGSGDELWIATARPESFQLVVDHVAGLRASPRNVRGVLATRAEIQDRIAAYHRRALTLRMRSRVAPRFSCRSWRPDNARRIAWAAALAGAMALGLGLAPVVTLIGLIAWAFAALVIASCLKLACAVAHLAPRPAPPEEAPTAPSDLPVISIIAPLFREPKIAESLIKRLERLDYPRDRLEIILALEEVDSQTREALDRASLPPWMRVVVVPDGQPRTKPRAMNYALDFCMGDIIGIYDAEDAPDPDQLRKVAARFAVAPPDVVCLQGALDFYNPAANWMARCFTVEYNTWFRLLLPGMARLGFAVPLGGTTLFFRREPLEDLGGWDAHNVTEDADLGFRLARAGYRTEVLDTTTGEEANNRPLAWVKQRSRWLKGYLVTYIVHMQHPVQLFRDLGAWRFLGFQAHFISALTGFALAPLLWSFWLILFGLWHPFDVAVPRPWLHGVAATFLGVEAMTILFGLIATRRARHRHLWPWVPTIHLYWPLGCLAMWKALYELVTNPFYWDKTQHGHSLADTADPVAEAEAEPWDTSGVVAEIHAPPARTANHPSPPENPGRAERPYTTEVRPPESSFSRVT